MEKHCEPQDREIKDPIQFREICDRKVFPFTSTYTVFSLDRHGNPIPGVEPILEDRLRAMEDDIALRSDKFKCHCEALSNEEIDEIFE